MQDESRQKIAELTELLDEARATAQAFWTERDHERISS